MFKFITLLALLVSCGPKHTGGTEAGSVDKSALADLRDHYLAEIVDHQDSDGFIDTDHCDSLLFTALASYGGASVNLKAAEESPGRWLRRPTSYPECWANDKSRSTVSRDGIVGLMWATMDMAESERLEILEDLWDYGIARDWFMGDGRYAGADTYFTYPFVGLLADMIHWSGGDSSLRQNYGEGLTDCEAFQCHIQALRIHLRGVVTGSISDGAKNSLRDTHLKYLDNPLMSYIYGYWQGSTVRMQLAVDQLVEYYDPAKDGFCEFWPLQENGGESNWERCEEADSTGAGFLFTSQLMLDY